MAVVLEAKNLEKRFKDFVAVNKINFKVKEGEVFGFLGPNGAGKTTTMKIIQCVSPKTSGDLKVFGLDVNEHPREIKQHMGVVPQMDNLDPDFSVIKNLIQYSRYFDIPIEEAKKRANDLVDYVQLNDKKESPIDKLSGGMKRRLVLARAMINNPKLLILDEPTTGLDPQARHLIWEKLKDLSSRGITVILTTHYMEEAARLCDRIVIMDNGKILVEGTPKNLIKKHVGDHIIEAENTIEIKTCLEKNNIEYEIANESVEIYSENVPHITNLILKKCTNSSVIARPATLEDVFLKLTGRKLRE
ncbi:MAG TPA: ATP-binding cassette domain-containing protein [Methanofastidiosum sp.]|nr:ATP-binding cassette domain-containing protein [Methanofastidiosum sp.]HQF90113.1 ATP-binding cassette domain-containing protein [Methanofastidiosum sp.]HQG61868.1 ATP-binding cassette domain-containing protein [Methanofastidiosum sp.]HQK85073.1 ATP-binding cassette domain-containing protein [Methanofastidiosum sp.]